MTTDPLEGWTFDPSGKDWIGVNITLKRRTALKGTEEQAKADVLKSRFVCRKWPECPHRDPDECTRAIKAQKRRI